MNQHENGYTLVELIFTLALTSILLALLSTTWLYAEHMHANLNQARMAERILNNIAEELSSTQYQWNSKQWMSWRQLAKQYLPNSSLNLTPENIQLDWPSDKPMMRHCQPLHAGQSCMAIALK